MSVPNLKVNQRRRLIIISSRGLLIVTFSCLCVLTLISQTVLNTKLIATSVDDGITISENYFLNQNPNYHNNNDILLSNQDNIRKQFDDLFDQARKRQSDYDSSRNDDDSFFGSFEPEKCDPSLLSNVSLFPIKDGCLIEKVYDGFRPYCRFYNLTFNPDCINSVRLGGEDLKTVMGQDEKDEDVTYIKGALILSREVNIPEKGGRSYLYLNPVFNSSIVLDNANNFTTICNDDDNNTIKGITIFIRRYEYVNLYHTMTDLWSVWTIYRRYHPQDITGIVVLDAHPAGNLDEVWETLFGHFGRIRTFLDNKSTCFEQVLFPPSGYESHIHRNACNDKDFGDAFSKFVLDKYGLSNVTKIPGRIVMIDRKSYIAHARSNINATPSRMITNLPELAEWIRTEIPQIYNDNNNIQIVTLHEMTFREQLLTIRQADFLIGRHGAGLTHLLFLDKHAHIIELGLGSNQKHFYNLSCWRNHINYHHIFSIRDYIRYNTFYKEILPILNIVYDDDK